MPATCDSTETVLKAWPAPMACNCTGIVLRSTWATVTGTAVVSRGRSIAPLPRDACAELALFPHPASMSDENNNDIDPRILKTVVIISNNRYVRRLQQKYGSE